MNTCGQCGKKAKVCDYCHNCVDHCLCRQMPTISDKALFDADELGLDPETDNSPGTESRHA